MDAKTTQHPGVSDDGDGVKLNKYIDDMEREHEVLKTMLAQVLSRPPDSAAHAFEVAAELLSYMEMHFAAEEKFMEMIQFPHRVSHGRNHRHVFSILSDATKQAVGHNELWSFIGYFLNRWLSDHIAHEDSRILEYFNKCSKPV